MSDIRLHFRVALFLACFVAQSALAAELPKYQTLETDGKPTRRLRSEPVELSRYPTVISLARSPDGQSLRTVNLDGQVLQWSLSQSAGPALVAETGSEPACSVLSSDASLLAFADPDGSVAVMEVKTKQIKFRDHTTPDRTVTLSFSSDARMLAGVTDAGKIRVWEAAAGSVLCERETLPSSVQSVAFSPVGKQLAVASSTQEVLLHGVSKQDPKHAPPKPRAIRIGESRVTALAFTPGGKQIVIAAADGTANVYDLTTNRPPLALAAHPFAIWSIAFEPRGRRMVTGSWDGTIRLWDTKSWQETQSVKAHEESVVALLVDAERGLISAGLDGKLLYWMPDLPSIAPTGMIAGRTDPVWVAVYAPDGKTLFVGGRGRRFELWDVEKKELLVSREGHPTTRCAVFSPDGKTLATGGDDGKIFLVDPATGKTRQTLLRPPGAVSAVVFADEGRTLVSGCDGHAVKLWDVATGQEKATWREHKQQIYCANISPDGKWLITGGGNWTTGDPGELIVWDLKTGHVRANLTGHTLAVWTIVFTPDGQRFASSDSSGAVKVWDLETFEEARTLRHETWVRALAMSPDGKTLAVGCGDGSVRLWSTTTWQQKTTCAGHDGFTFWLQFAPDGKTLATSGNDGTVRFWPTEK